MKFFKKWGILLVTIFFVIAIAITIVFSKKSVDELKVAVSDRDGQINELKGSLNEIGPCAKGYVLNTDVRAGELVNLEYFVEVSVPEKLGLGVITTTDDLEGAYFRTSLKEGTVVTTEDINYTEVLDSERYVDIVLDQLPIGVIEGDYIDIRITFPYGEDFIGLAGKKVEEINSSILKIKLNENEIMVYNSMLLDRILYGGTQIYAVTYVDAGSQETAEAFYPINDNQSELLLENPNALEISKQEMLLKRKIVEEKLGGNITTTDISAIDDEELSDSLKDQLERLNDNIQDLRDRTQDKVAAANEVINERRKKEEEERKALEEGGSVNEGVTF